MAGRPVNAKHPHALGRGMTSQRSRQRLVSRLREKGIDDETVLAAISQVERHRFVDEALASRAYDDTALPIGYGQTISQPFVVARMTALLLADGPLDSVLEVGTGSGYQTAVLALLVDRVYSIERQRFLAQQARDRLRRLGYTNVWLKYGDGALGWPQYAPFDGIVVTAGAEGVPVALMEQLAVGGRLIIPVGTAGDQCLRVVRRTGDGYDTQDRDAVSFVPLLPDRD